MKKSKSLPVCFNQLFLYTDGACRGNPGPGATAYYAFIPNFFSLSSKEEIVLSHGGHYYPQTTNNEMELLAILEGISFVERLLIKHKKNNLSDSSPPIQIQVFSDSQYCVKGMNEWRFKWANQNWHRSGKAPLKNKDLWQQLDQKEKILKNTYPLNFSFIWVKGHDINKWNIACDTLANKILDTYSS